MKNNLRRNLNSVFGNSTEYFNIILKGKDEALNNFYQKREQWGNFVNKRFENSPFGNWRNSYFSQQSFDKHENTQSETDIQD